MCLISLQILDQPAKNTISCHQRAGWTPITPTSRGTTELSWKPTTVMVPVQNRTLTAQMSRTPTMRSKTKVDTTTGRKLDKGIQARTSQFFKKARSPTPPLNLTTALVDLTLNMTFSAMIPIAVSFFCDYQATKLHKSLYFHKKILINSS